MVKFLLYSKPMPDSKVTPEALTFTKNELKVIKDLNIALRPLRKLLQTGRSAPAAPQAY